VWDRFAADDHRVIHLWRDATFDQYVSRLLALASGEWKGREASAGGEDPLVAFDREDYLGYREAMRADVEWTRAHYGDTGRCVEIEYRQLTDHAFIEDVLQRLFGERVKTVESRRRQRRRPKLEYLSNPAEAEAFVTDSIRDGFAPGPARGDACIGFRP